VTTLFDPAEAPPFIRQDGWDKVTGAGRYAADMTVTGMLHGAFRTAGVPHARIRRIDASRARALPGVRAVITADDVPDVRYGAYLQDRVLFARDVVRWEGDLMAAVAATSPELAAEAAGLIEVDFEPLPAVVDMEVATAPATPLIHPDWASYEGDAELVREGNLASRSTIVKGDAARGMAEADVVVRGRYVADGSHAVPIEPRAIRPNGRATTSRSGRRRRSRSGCARVSPRPSVSPSTRSASSFRTSGAASVPSASWGLKPRWPPSLVPPAGRSSWSSPDATSSCCPITGASG
jgi:CO/xanthine dehydrogenase Mo-binding subunit